MSQWRHNGLKEKLKLFQQGENRWHETARGWHVQVCVCCCDRAVDITVIDHDTTANRSLTGPHARVQVLFSNLHTCCYGPQTTGVFGVAPPTMAEYLYSVNNGLLTPPHAAI